MASHLSIEASIVDFQRNGSGPLLQEPCMVRNVRLMKFGGHGPSKIPYRLALYYKDDGVVAVLGGVDLYCSI